MSLKCIVIILLLDGPKTLQLRIPTASAQQPYLVPAGPLSQSFNAYESLYHMGKLQSQYPSSIMRDEYAQKMSLYSPNYASIFANGYPLPHAAASRNSPSVMRTSPSTPIPKSGAGGHLTTRSAASPAWLPKPASPANRSGAPQCCPTTGPAVWKRAQVRT